MIKIAVCDDEKSLVSVNRNIVEDYIRDKKEVATIEEYSNGEFLLADVQEGIYFDLILLDIEMPHKNGMEIAPQIKKMSAQRTDCLCNFTFKICDRFICLINFSICAKARASAQIRAGIA